MRVEEETVIRKMDKKSKTGKKNKLNDLEEFTDCADTAPTRAETNIKFSKEHTERKNKKKPKVGVDFKLDGITDEAVNGKGYVEVSGGLHKEKGQKKKKKRILEFDEVVTGCTDAASTGMENSFKLSKEDKINEKKHNVGRDIVVNGIRDEPPHGKGYVEVDGGFQSGKDRKKKWKLETYEDIDTSSDNIQLEGEGKRSLQINDGMDALNDSEFKPRKDKRKRHKEQRKKDGSNSVSFSMEILEGKNTGTEVVKGNKSFEKEDITEIENGEGAEEKKNKKRRRDDKDNDANGKKQTKDWKKVEKSRECNEDVMAKVEKKSKREKKKVTDDISAGSREIIFEELGNESTNFEDKDSVDSEGNAHSTINKTQEIGAKNGKIGKRKKTKSVKNGSENPKPKGKSKKVTFSGRVEVFPSSDDPSSGKEENQEEQLVRGKRFSREEDEIIKEAVFNYIKDHGLGEQGLNMVLHCSSHPEIKNCWKDIGAAIPYRPYSAIYYRAHVLFERDEKRRWTTEEYELLRKYQEKHANDWKSLADELGKHRFHVKDAWRRIKLPNMKKGHWSQEEYQTLFDLVNTDLQMKAFEEKRSKHGMLRDNICWSAISDKLSTRTNSICCRKWYSQLTSSMVAEGNWADTDDYRLVDALFNLDACCLEDVDWDNLLDHRSGNLCRKRWDQMVRHIGPHGTKSFAEQVEILAKRYCPYLQEAREAWDSKPVVP